VVFDEVCGAYTALGPDLLNESVMYGQHYTAVFIGPGGPSFRSPSMVDAYGMLITGKKDDNDLRASAEAAGLYREGKPQTCVVTQESAQRYQVAMERIRAAASSYYVGKLPVLHSLLRSTTSGRQGVPPENMMMHLWRYIRKITARELRSREFLTHAVPQDGMLTVFYENNVEQVSGLLD